MFKGHVCIDLHNHKSGFTERYEDDNLVTDMPSKILSYTMLTGRNLNNILPIGQVIFGGIKLINKTFTDTVNGNIFIPGDSSLVGCGAYNYNNTASKYTGTFNAAESEYDYANARYKHVWDFATSQGNGTINALGLTHVRGGVYGWGDALDDNNGYNDYGIYRCNGMYQMIYYDEQNKEIYGIDSNFHVVKTNGDFFTLSLKSSIDSYGYYWFPDAVDTGIVIENPYDWGGYSNGWQIGYDGYIYAGELDSSGGSGVSLILHKRKVSDLSFDLMPQETYILPSLSDTSYDLDSLMINKNKQRMFIQTIDKEHIYMINTSTQSNIVDINLSVLIPGVRPDIISQTPEGDIYLLQSAFSPYYFGRINTFGSLDFSDSSYYQGPTITRGKYLENGIRLAVQPTSSLGYAVLGLAPMCSNFNLGSSIEKTPSRSMKVTYSITQV